MSRIRDKTNSLGNQLFFSRPTFYRTFLTLMVINGKSVKANRTIYSLKKFCNNVNYLCNSKFLFKNERSKLLTSDSRFLTIKKLLNG